MLAEHDHNLVVRLELTEVEMARLRLGMAALVHLQNGATLTGKVANIAARASDSSGLFAIEIDLPDQTGLMAGQWVEVELIAQTDAQVVALPVAALAAVTTNQAVFWQRQADTYVRRQLPIVHHDGRYLFLATQQPLTDVVIRGWQQLRQ